MADIFHEIEEELRRDKALAFWKKHGTKVAVLAVAFVAAVGGWRFYQHQQLSRAEASGARYEQALELLGSDRADEGTALLRELERDGSGGYRLVSRLRLAAETAKADPARGVEAYEAIAADTSVPAGLRDLARLRAVIAGFDQLDAAAVTAKLEPLASPASTWRNTARELLGLAALKAGDYEAAGRWFDQIAADREAPPALRQRVNIYLELVRSGPVGKAG